MGWKPRSCYGTEGVVGLSCQIEKIEEIFCISAYTEDCRVKYSTFTLMDSALNWWNNHDKCMQIDEAYVMGQEPLKQMMIK